MTILKERLEQANKLMKCLPTLGFHPNTKSLSKYACTMCLVTKNVYNSDVDFF